MRKEYIFAMLIAVSALILSNLYLIFGILVPNPDLVFLGRHVVNSQDMYTYVSFIEQGRQGHLLFQNLYSTESQTTTLVRPSYAFLGVLASVTQVPSVVAYQIGRVLFSIIFFFVLYVFLMQFFKSPKRQLLAFTVTLFSSGLGFALGRFWQDSSDLWIPEANTFMSLQEAPHVILSQTLMLLAFLFLLKGWKSGQVKYFIITFASLILLGFEHPYNLFICTGTVVLASIYLWFRSNTPKKLLALGTGSVIFSTIIGILYQYVETIRNPILNSWKFQSNSPIPFDYILGFGFLLFFAFFGIEVFLKSRRPSQIFILSWVAASFLLMYSPVYFQRRLSEGLHIPLSILATEGIIVISVFLSSFVLKNAKKTVTGIVTGILVVILALGSFVGVYADIVTISRDNTNAYYYYLLNGELASMNWLRIHTSQKDIVLSNWFYGNILPGVTGRKVYVGHKAQTKDFDKKVDYINSFILNNNTAQAYKFLKDNGITYIYVGANDSMLTYGFKPAQKPYLIKVFESGGAKVYKVR